MRRVYVTGIGVVSALGLTTAEFWRGLISGGTGIRATDWQDTDGPPVAARVPAYDFRQFVDDEKVTRVCHRSMELLLIAADAAVREAQLENTIEPSRLGVSIGIGPIEQRTDDYVAFTKAAAAGAEGRGPEAWRRLHPMRRLRHLPNIPAAVLSMRYGANGPSLTFVSGIVAGLQAVLEGFRMIAEGRADAVVCGGTDSRFSPSLWPVIASQHECAASVDPDGACRPFDRRHAGIVAGEGAAVLVLVAEEQCERTQAVVRAEVLGGAVEGSPKRGISAAVEQVASQFGRRHPLPDAAVAHGDGSMCGDCVEAWAFGRAPYLSNVRAITSLQAAVGHSFSAAGALTAAAGCLSLAAGEVPPIRNLSDPIASVAFVAPGSHPEPPHRVMASVLDQRGVAGAVLLGSAPC
jgi:3-oxoacyl-[acyl-carrier-protein] synthase II